MPASRPPPQIPARPGPARPSPHDQALIQAGAALQARRPEEAERLAGKVLRADRGNVAAGQVLGAALLMQGRAAEALEPLERAAKRSGDAAVETLLGRALAACGRTDEGLAMLAQATERRPALPQAFLELGEQLGALGRFDEAAATFERGLAASPDALVLKLGLGYLGLQRNDRASARRLFLEVRAAAPERIDAQAALAKVFALDGDYAAAADLYRAVLELRPDDTATRLELGKCLLEMGRREAGEAILKGVASEAAGPAIMALSAAPHGRFFLRPSAAAKFLRKPGG
jgi:tetratricopeptide (TPR) repeat protein